MSAPFPIYLSVAFGLLTLAVVLFFWWVLRQSAVSGTVRKAGKILVALFVWADVQILLSVLGVYSNDMRSLPPNLVLFGIAPALWAILVIFATRQGREFVDSIPVVPLTYLHTLRIPVELVLYGLAVYKTIPETMTFEGYNFDILAGFTAPFVAYWACTKTTLGRNFLLFWNLACLGLLLNIVVLAFLSAPTPLQKFGFGQPNVAIFYFPMSLLPTVVVPIVLFSHLVAIRQMLKRRQPADNPGYICPTPIKTHEQGH